MSKRIFPKNLLSALLVAAGLLSTAYASGGEHHTAPKMDPTNDPSLQRGAKYFVNYCSGCHSLKYMRFNRLAKDIGITDDEGNVAEGLLRKDLMFTTTKIGDTLEVALTPEEGKKWFGVVPPDLSLEARSRGSAWIYHYLRGYYVDPTKRWGVDNIVFPGTAMPNILLNLQGEQFPVYEKGQDAEMMAPKISHLELRTAGQLTPQQFDAVVYDITNFLTYVSDPIKEQRTRVGVWVMLFLVLMTTVLYLLKREYWKDLH